MLKKDLTKSEAKKEIEDFFRNIKNKTPRDVKKIKRLAMSHNIPLKEKRKLFCKNCLTVFSGKEKVRIKNGKKIIECLNCKNIGMWGIK